MSSVTASAVLNAVFNATPYSLAGGVFMKLHTADPGAAGTANPATEVTRKAVSFGAPLSGVIANDVAVTWVAIAGSQDATHFSLWDADTGGNFIGSGTITANPYSAGDTYNVAIGACTISLAVAA